MAKIAEKDRIPTPAQYEGLAMLAYDFDGKWVYPIEMRAFTAQSLSLRGWALRRRSDMKLKITPAGRAAMRRYTLKGAR
jgi:hypothetical protein